MATCKHCGRMMQEDLDWCDHCGIHKDWDEKGNENVHVSIHLDTTDMEPKHPNMEERFEYLYITIREKPNYRSVSTKMLKLIAGSKVKTIDDLRSLPLVGHTLISDHGELILQIISDVDRNIQRRNNGEKCERVRTDVATGMQKSYNEGDSKREKERKKAEMTVKEILVAVKDSKNPIMVWVTGRIINVKLSRNSNKDFADLTVSNLITDKGTLTLNVHIWDELLDFRDLCVGKLITIKSGSAYYQYGKTYISCKTEFNTTVRVSNKRGHLPRKSGVLGQRTKATLSHKKCPQCGESMEDRLNIWYCPSCHYNDEQ